MADPYGEILFDRLSGDVRFREATCDLSPNESALFLAIARRNGEVASYESLVGAVWPDPSAEPDGSRSTLKVMVCKIRTRMKKSGLPEVIATAWGRGYFTALPVRVLPPEGSMVVQGAGIRLIRRLIEICPDEKLAMYAEELFGV